MATTITRRDVLLSWALSEALSPRWEARYEGVPANPIVALPDELPPHEQAMLLYALQQHRGRFIREYVDPASRFELETIPASEVGGLVLMPWMTHSQKLNRVTLSQYAKGAYDHDLANDPRNAARAMLENPSPRPYYGFPILAWDERLQCNVLIEGCARMLYVLLRQERGEELGHVVCMFCRNK